MKCRLAVRHARRNDDRVLIGMAVLALKEWVTKNDREAPDSRSSMCQSGGNRHGAETLTHAVTTCLPRCVSKGRSGARRLRCSHFASRRAGGRVVHQADEQAAGRSNRNAAEHDGATVDTQARM